MAKPAKAKAQAAQDIDCNWGELLLNSAFDLAVTRTISNRDDLNVVAPPDLITELLDQLRPRPDREAVCRDRLDKNVAFIRKVKKVDVFSAAAIKVELVRFHKALKKVSDLSLQLSPAARELIFSENDLFPGEVDDHMREIEDVCSYEIRGKKGARPRRISKLAAAVCAHTLFENYSSFPPTLTKDGPFFRVASLLF